MDSENTKPASSILSQRELDALLDVPQYRSSQQIFQSIKENRLKGVEFSSETFIQDARDLLWSGDLDNPEFGLKFRRYLRKFGEDPRVWEMMAGYIKSNVEGIKDFEKADKYSSAAVENLKSVLSDHLNLAEILGLFDDPELRPSLERIKQRYLPDKEMDSIVEEDTDNLRSHYINAKIPQMLEDLHKGDTVGLYSIFEVMVVNIIAEKTGPYLAKAILDTNDPELLQAFENYMRDVDEVYGEGTVGGQGAKIAIEALEAEKQKRQESQIEKSEEGILKEQQEREKKLIDEVVKNGDSLLRTWSNPVPNIQYGRGKQDLNPEDRLRPAVQRPLQYWRLPLEGRIHLAEATRGGNSESQENATRSLLQNNQIHEMVVVSPVTVESGGGQRTAMVKDATSINSDEEACLVNYVAGDWARYQHEGSYRDGMGRPGNELDFKIIVGRELASKVVDEIKINPTFIRSLVFEMLRQKYHPDIYRMMTQEHGMPPYNAWAKQYQPGLYLVDGVNNQFKEEDLPKFNPGNVIRFNIRRKDGYQYAAVEESK